MNKEKTKEKVLQLINFFVKHRKDKNRGKKFLHFALKQEVGFFEALTLYAMLKDLSYYFSFKVKGKRLIIRYRPGKKKEFEEYIKKLEKVGE